ncbi:MAG: DUF1902 domain-containing protein [Comamonadaceae bacterium]
MYRVGLPGWKLAARWGVPLLVRVQVHFDPESKSYWAESFDLDGLVVSGQNLEELKSEANLAADELLSLVLQDTKAHATTELRIRDTLPMPA